MSARRCDRSAILPVAAGGAIGAVLRQLFVLLFPEGSGAFPVVTLAENVSGAFLLGLVLVALLRSPRLATRWTPFLAVGILGSFTTFSTVSLELVELMAAGSTGTAFLYLAASVGAGLAAAALGILLGATLMDRLRVAR